MKAPSQSSDEIFSYNDLVSRPRSSAFLLRSSDSFSKSPSLGEGDLPFILVPSLSSPITFCDGLRPFSRIFLQKWPVVVRSGRRLSVVAEGPHAFLIPFFGLVLMLFFCYLELPFDVEPSAPINPPLPNPTPCRRVIPPYPTSLGSPMPLHPNSFFIP